jgi:hypothetical protein
MQACNGFFLSTYSNIGFLWDNPYSYKVLTLSHAYIARLMLRADYEKIYMHGNISNT